MNMRRAITMVVVVAGLLTLIGGSGRAQDKKPDATIELSEGRGAAGIGYNWGGGTLTDQGKKHKVKVEGLSGREVGITRAAARGEGLDLRKPEDFSGNY